MHTRFRLGVRLPLLACRSYKSKAHGVDISALTHILSVDRERMVVTVEGAVIMGHLTAQLLEQGLLPQVTPEFPTFSVSGLGEFQLLVSLQWQSAQAGLHGHVRSWHVVSTTGIRDAVAMAGCTLCTALSCPWPPFALCVAFVACHSVKNHLHRSC